MIHQPQLLSVTLALLVDPCMRAGDICLFSVEHLPETDDAKST